MMSLARPKSQIFTSFPSQMRTFLAARSRCTHCRGRHCHCKGHPDSPGEQPSSSTSPFLWLQGQESPHITGGISSASRNNNGAKPLTLATRCYTTAKSDCGKLGAPILCSMGEHRPSTFGDHTAWL